VGAKTLFYSKQWNVELIFSITPTEEYAIMKPRDRENIVHIKGSTAEIARQGIEVQLPSNQELKSDGGEVTHEDGIYQSVVMLSGRSLDEVKEIDKELDEIFERGLNGPAGYDLSRLLNDPDKSSTCLKLLLEKHSADIAINEWAGIAAKDVSTAAAIFKNKEISQGLLDSGWLKQIAGYSLEHAGLILKEFEGRLGEPEKSVISTFYNLEQDRITEAAKPTRRP
jgi:hypothetical protein